MNNGAQQAEPACPEAEAQEGRFAEGLVRAGNGMVKASVALADTRHLPHPSQTLMLLLYTLRHAAAIFGVRFSVLAHRAAAELRRSNRQSPDPPQPNG